MKITDLQDKNSTTDAPSTLVANYLVAEALNIDFVDYIAGFDYESIADIKFGVKYVINAVSNDKYLSAKRTQEDNPRFSTIRKRFAGVVSNFDKYDRYANSIAEELWYGSYARLRLEKRQAAYFPNTPPNNEVFCQTKATLQQMYCLSDIDMAKITYFVQQVRAGNTFPASLRRMLYIWGKQKKTGKTTVAETLIAILNADVVKNIQSYSSLLSKELQIATFVVPLIAYCNAVLLDECFYSDMGKTYDTFKRRITQNGGSARLVFGHEFQWEGCPNYIATSNTPLRKFIKDWDDRRFLAVEFKSAPSVQADEEQIYNLWQAFVFNVPQVQDWYAATAAIENVAFEVGEREERAQEFEIELRKSDFLTTIQNLDFDANCQCAPKNRISLKFFVDYFAHTIGATEANKRRGEIEKAAIAVFGEKYSTQSYWLLSTLRQKSYEVGLDESELQNLNKTENEDKLPF